MTTAFFLMAPSAFIFSLSTGFVISCIVLFSLGLAVGCMQIAAVKAIIDWFPFSGRATAMGIKQTGVNAGGVAGSLALPLILGIYGWHVIFWGMSVLAFLFALCSLVLYRNTVDRRGGDVLRSYQPVRLKEVILSLKEVHYVVVTVAGLFLIAVQFSFASYVVLYLNRSLRLSLELSARWHWRCGLCRPRSYYPINTHLGFLSSRRLRRIEPHGLDGDLAGIGGGTLTREIYRLGDWCCFLFRKSWIARGAAFLWFSH